MTSACDGVRRQRELTFAELSAASSPLSPYSLCVAVSFKMRNASNAKLIVNGNFVEFCIINTVAPCSTNPRGDYFCPLGGSSFIVNKLRIVFLETELPFVTRTSSPPSRRSVL